MKNKNPLYIVFGIGAGIIAYYLFCKKKDDAVAVVDGKVDGKADEKPATRDAILGGGSVTPQNVTILPTTTPIVLNGTPIVQGKPPVTIINTSTKPVPRPVPTTSFIPKPVPTTSFVPRPAPTTSFSTRPILTTTPIGVRPMTSISSRFNGFDGSSFEVGDCLNDL